MPCLIALFALIGPRVALVVTWLTSNMISRAIDSWVVAVLGFLFLPWTTLAYVVFYDVGRRPRGASASSGSSSGSPSSLDIGGYVGGRRWRD